MSGVERNKSSNRSQRQPNFLLEDEYIKDTLRVSNRNPFSRTSWQYYLTNKRVVETKSNMTAAASQDIALEDIVGIEQNKQKLLPRMAGGLLIILAGVALISIQEVPDDIIMTLFAAYTFIGGGFVIIYGLFFRSNEYELSTANPDVSLTITVSRNKSNTQKFISQVRKESHQSKQINQHQ